MRSVECEQPVWHFTADFFNQSFQDGIFHPLPVVKINSGILSFVWPFGKVWYFLHKALIQGFECFVVTGGRA
jgi:hypothetical protein